jgi:hypothetical protein
VDDDDSGNRGEEGEYGVKWARGEMS